MDDPVLTNLIDRLADKNGTISHFVLGDIYKNLVGDSLELAAPTIRGVASWLQERGATSLETAVEVGGLKTFVATTAEDHQASLAVVKNGRVQVATVVFGSKTSPEDERMDRLFAQVLKEDYDAAKSAAQRASRHAENALVMLHEGPLHALTAVIRDTATDGYCQTQVVRAGRAIHVPAHDGEAECWSPGSRDFRRIDGWRGFSKGLKAIADITGEGPRFTKDAEAFMNRHAPRNLESFPAYQAADDLVKEILRRSGGILGDAADRILSRVESSRVESDLKHRLTDVTTSIAFCRTHGHFGRDQGFFHNDGDNAVWLWAEDIALSRTDRQLGPDHGFHSNDAEKAVWLSPESQDVVCYEDQNHSFVLQIVRGAHQSVAGLKVYRDHPNAPRRTNWPARLLEKAAAWMEFSVRDGKPEIIGTLPAIEADIKAWSSLESCMATGVCCLEEKYAPKPPKTKPVEPAPGMSM